MLLRYCCSLLILLFSLRLTAQPLFDSHLHYTVEDAQRFTPQAIVNLLDSNAISYAAVSSTPSAHMNKLYQLAPDRIVPLLGVHHYSADKSSWTTDKTFISYLKKELERGYWRGIGELHIFARDRHSKVFKQVITLASAWKLPLLIHGDPAVIDTLYEIAPDQPVIWAHAGTFPYPDLVSDYLRRYPNLSIDVSMRDERIATDGIINDDWYELFVTYPNRVMVGVDTYTTSRWDELNSAVGTIRNWLAQLPDEIAVQLSFLNAAKLYKKPLIINADKGAQGDR
ncbi:MAG: TatD family hydrolase [Rhodothermales bacterium]